MLSELAGTDELARQIDATRQEIYQGRGKAAAANDAYLAYFLCLAVKRDASIPEADKAAAVQGYADSVLRTNSLRSSAVQDCDSFASSPDDLTRPAGTPGIPFDQIETERAEAACRLAVGEQTSPRLQYELARALEAGHKSVTEAAHLYRLAADEGFAPAQSNLGLLYENGAGVDQSYQEAVRFYRLASDQGFAPAQFRLALLVEQGHGVEHSDAEIVRLLRLASDQGFTPAQGALGLMYEQGRGVAQSDAEALRLYRLAADKGSTAAREHLDALIASGRGSSP